MEVEEGGGFPAERTMGSGAAEIRRFHFSCNWEKKERWGGGLTDGTSSGTAAPDSDIHFLFVFSS